MVIVGAVDMWKTPWISRETLFAWRNNVWVSARVISTLAGAYVQNARQAAAGRLINRIYQQTVDKCNLICSNLADQDLNGMGKGRVVPDVICDLLAGVNHSCVVTTAKLLANLRERSVG